jgi:tRNA threonylcarbamoyladenosine biosynthesis protein TsaE
MIEKVITTSPAQTKKLGQNLAKEIFLSKKKRKKAIIIALKGELGGGKTTFLQGFAKGLGIREKILSPTFVILKRFKIPKSIPNSKPQTFSFKNFYHLDCYRINKPKEIFALGYKEIEADPRNIIAIEWPEKLKDTLPKNTIWVRFKFLGKNKREIRVSGKKT